MRHTKNIIKTTRTQALLEHEAFHRGEAALRPWHHDLFSRQETHQDSHRPRNHLHLGGRLGRPLSMAPIFDGRDFEPRTEYLRSHCVPTPVYARSDRIVQAQVSASSSVDGWEKGPPFLPLKNITLSLVSTAQYRVVRQNSSSRDSKMNFYAHDKCQLTRTDLRCAPIELMGT